MKEEVLQFGPGRSLLGVLSRPDKVNSALPAVLIPNTGLDHRVGPNRLHVHLCRAIANAGYCALRLDLAGQGDSQTVPGVRPSSLSDLRTAMDELERLGLATRFLPLGLCSGAHDAHQVAVADPRVTGAGFLDGYTYPTRRHYFTRQFRRLTDLPRVVAYIRDQLRRPVAGTQRTDIGADLGFYTQPTQEEVELDLRRFTDERHMPLWFLYTGGMSMSYNYSTQWFDNFPMLKTRPGVELHYLAHADHTFTRREMRGHLVKLLLSWLVRNFPPDAAPAR